jgi:NADPH:quinone reductase-like Zn-dependent oxidoreductase
MDFAGTVVSIADGTETQLKPGDAVFGGMHGSNPAAPDTGAFSEYLRADPGLLLRKPDSLEAEDAATFGTAISTCLLALWSKDSLGLEVTPENLSTVPLPVLVYGGSTATGTIAIQLLKLSGLDPIATCSPRNFDLVRSYGASAVFDYAKPDVGATIRAHTGGRMKYAIDCISDEESVGCCFGAIQRAGGRYVSLEHVAEERLRKRRAVDSSFILAMEVFGKGVALGGAYEREPSEEKRLLAVKSFNLVQKLFDQGKLKAHPTQKLNGGLEGILDGLTLLKSGSVSGRKLVASVS